VLAVGVAAGAEVTKDIIVGGLTVAGSSTAIKAAGAASGAVAGKIIADGVADHATPPSLLPEQSGPKPADARTEEMVPESHHPQKSSSTPESAEAQARANIENWKPGDPMPNADSAQINPAKFEKYSMDPANVQNNGKWQAWEKLGYDVKTEAGRQIATQDIMKQLSGKLLQTPAQKGMVSDFGKRFELDVEIVGANGRAATLGTKWQIDAGTTIPRLITNWAKVH